MTSSRRSALVILNVDQVSHIVLLFSLLTLNKIPTGIFLCFSRLRNICCRILESVEVKGNWVNEMVKVTGLTH